MEQVKECQLVQLAIVRRLDENVLHSLAVLVTLYALRAVCGGKLDKVEIRYLTL